MAGQTTFEDLHRLLSSLPEDTFLVRKISLSAEELAEVERDFGPPIELVRRLLASWGVFTVEPRAHIWRRIDMESIGPDQVVPSWLLENRITVLPGCGGKEPASVFNEPELLEKLRAKRLVPLLHVAGTQYLIACNEAGGFRITWEEGADFTVSVRKDKQQPLEALIKTIVKLRDTTAVVAPAASVLVNRMGKLRFRGKVAAQMAEALLAKPPEEVEPLIPDLVAATVKTPLLRWVLDLTRETADQNGDIRKSLIEAFGKGGRDDLVLTALARRHADDPALLPLVSEALGQTGEVVEIAAKILCTFPESPEARALSARVASAALEQRTEVRGQLKCLEALARQRSEYFGSTLADVLPRLPDFAYLWLLDGLATAQASVAPQREMLLERYRSGWTQPR